MRRTRTICTGTRKALRRALACLLAAALAFSLCGLPIAYGAETDVEADGTTPGVAPQAVTDSGDCGPVGNESDVTWSLEDGTLTISGTGDMGYYDPAPWHFLPVKSLVISPGVSSISNLAFANCDQLASVSIPASVSVIGSKAFYGCTSLPSVSIPAGVTSIEGYAFYACASLTAFTVAERNAHYSSDGRGVLFDKDRTRLIQYPAGNAATSYAVPEGVEQIDQYAFENRSSLVSIFIPASVSLIGDSVFGGCAATLYCEAPSEPGGWHADWDYGYRGQILWGQAPPDTEAPVLSTASASRRSASAATVSFSSSEVGTLYWAAVAPGAPVPSIDNMGAGMPLAAGLQSFEVVGLATGAAWDVCVVAKDAAGNLSAVLRVGVPAWEYTVTFRGWDGKAIGAAQKVAYGSSATAPAAPPRTGHTFAGWDKTFASVASDLTVTAKYKANTYTVKFDANGGKVGGKASASVKRAYGTALGTLAKPVRSGYAFQGWFTGKAGGKQVSATTRVAKPVTYYAHWKANGPVVTLNAAGGKVGGAATASMVKAKGAAVGKLATPTRTGHAFLGWYTAKKGGTKVTAKTRVTRNVTYWAHWAKVHTVKLNANGGKVGGKASVSVKKTHNSKLGKLATPKRTGYQFLGWYTSKSGGKKVTAGTKVTKAVTLYAHWKRAR